MATTRTQIYLTTEQREQLDARCKREGKTLAAVVRDPVDAYIAAEQAWEERAKRLGY